MSRRTILTTLGIIMLIGMIGAGYIGWRWYTRDRVAVGTYRLAVPEGVSMRQVVDTERALMISDEVMKAVIADLGLVEHWGMASEEEALAHMRVKLELQTAAENDRMVVIYRDRNQALALEVLQAISDRYVAIKKRQQLLLGP